VLDAFLAASRAGDFEALVAVLHPEVVVRADFSPSRPRRSAVTRGAAAVARRALQGARPAAQAHPALVNGAAGVVLTMDGRPYAVFAFAIAEGKIVQIDAVADPDRVARLAAPVLASAYKELHPSHIAELYLSSTRPLPVGAVPGPRQGDWRWAAVDSQRPGMSSRPSGRQQPSSQQDQPGNNRQRR
jgi:ketosteroid isomerase-like protein